MTDRFIVCGSRPWCRETYREAKAAVPGNWLYVSGPEELVSALREHRRPRFLFFPHWSWRVDDDVLRRHECVCFHMADVPYGRGGSPLQNLIASGHRETVLAALRMTDEIDAGPVYMKMPLSLEGAAEEIFLRANRLAGKMIAEIVGKRLEPRPQEGEAVVFRRRRPEDSEIGSMSSLLALHDHVRMLDAEGYPKAFFIKDGYRYEFSRASLKAGRIIADVEITSLAEE